jgi:hypothetical protein
LNRERHLADRALLRQLSQDIQTLSLAAESSKSRHLKDIEEANLNRDLLINELEEAETRELSFALWSEKVLVAPRRRLATLQAERQLLLSLLAPITKTNNENNDLHKRPNQMLHNLSEAEKILKQETGLITEVQSQIDQLLAQEDAKRQILWDLKDDHSEESREIRNLQKERLLQLRADRKKQENLLRTRVEEFEKLWKEKEMLQTVLRAKNSLAKSQLKPKSETKKPEESPQPIFQTTCGIVV